MTPAWAKRRYPDFFYYGEQMGHRIHVSSSAKEVVRYCWCRLHKGTPRPWRKAIYLGALRALQKERDMMRRFRL